jgi:hypothetical protein
MLVIMKTNVKCQWALIKNQKGMSIVTAMSTVALVSLLAMAVAANVELQQKQLQAANIKLELDALNDEVKNLLTNERVCSGILGDLSSLGSQNSAVGTRLVLAGHIKEGEKYGRNLFLKRIELTQNDPAPMSATLRDGNVQIEIETQGIAAGGMSRVRNFPLTFEHSAGKITKCFLQVDAVQLCGKLGGTNFNWQNGRQVPGCTPVTQEDCRRWGGEIIQNVYDTPWKGTEAEYFNYSESYIDPVDGTTKTRGKSIKTRDDRRYYKIGTYYMCDMCKHLGGIRKNKTCVANNDTNFPPAKTGMWNIDWAKAIHYKCNDVMPKNYRVCNEMNFQKCTEKGVTKELCYTGKTLNEEKPGEELCEYKEASCN